MRLWVKPDQLAKLGITVTDIVNAIQAQNTVNPAGQVGGEPALKPWGDRKTRAEQYQALKVHLNQELSRLPARMSSFWPTTWPNFWQPLASGRKLA